MDREITLTFHNKGLRSFIEVDLCTECPRQDGKGCCGYYAPVFYPTDLAYLQLNHPAIIDYIFELDHLTILDTSVTVNNEKDGESYRCRFHAREGGCLLAQPERETICRHFVCPGIDWQQESTMQHWKKLFEELFEYEIELNNRLSYQLTGKGLTLKDPVLRSQFLHELVQLYNLETSHLPSFLKTCPVLETTKIVRPIKWGSAWPL